jgi:hypothetical protein
MKEMGSGHMVNLSDAQFKIDGPNIRAFPKSLSKIYSLNYHLKSNLHKNHFLYLFNFQ